MVETKTLGGRALTFERQEGRAPTLVCVHGSADNHYVYEELIAALPGRACVSLNLPGRAGTDGPPLSDAASMADFVRELVDSEVEGDFVLAGHSLGGAVAIELALDPPPGLKGIVLLATGAKLRVHPMILQLFEQVEKTGKHPPLPPGIYQEGADPAFLQRANERRLLTPVSTGAADWRAADSFDRMADLGDIRIPALVVAGTEDLLTPPKYADFMDAHLVNSELHIIEGAGHMLVSERAEQVAEWIEEFIGGLDH